MYSLQPVGFGLAAHAAVMVGNSTMLAIGGVRGGLTISAQVVSYDVLNDSWEVWERETLGLPGVCVCVCVCLCLCVRVCVLAFV